MARRILILMSKTGGGHRASAEALQAGFGLLYGDAFHVDVIDLLMDYLPWPLREAPKSYGFMSAKTPWLWRLLFEATDEGLTTKALDSTAARALSHSVERAFVEYQPDLVISVHPLAQHVSLRALKRLRLAIPFVTVITDLATMHPAWFHPDVQLCFVPTAEAYQTAQKYKLSGDQLRNFGLPLRPAFAALPERGLDLRRRLQMDGDLPAALVYGGGESAGKVTDIVEALDRQFGGAYARGQMVVVCGRDGKLQRVLAAREWSVPVRTLGYVDNMHEWMTACDCIVTKAGPGAIAESLACALPIALSGFIPGQEAGNVPFVINHGVGVYSDQPAQIASTVSYWFGEGRSDLQAMSTRAVELSNPRATFDIVAEIARLFDV